MMIEIKNWVSGDVIFKCEADSLRTAVEIAVGKGVSLKYADLRGAKLRYAKLRYADLRCANLSDAILHGANLGDADLGHAIFSYADLGDATLSNVDLCDVKLSDAILSRVPVIKNIHQSVYIAASAPDALNMDLWHTCETTHCRAGWVVHLAGDAGKELERVCGTPLAATLIYMASDPGLKNIPDFHANNQEALDDMKRLADQESAAYLNLNKEY